MTIVGGFDVHRKQITFDYVDTGTGEVSSGQISPATRRTRHRPAQDRQILQQCRRGHAITHSLYIITGLRNLKNHTITGQLLASGVCSISRSGDGRCCVVPVCSAPPRWVCGRPGATPTTR